MTTGMRRALAQLVDEIDLNEAVRRRAVQEAITDVLAWQWTRRAKVLDWASEQVIPPTFAAYRSKALPNDPFNALSNAYAAMNYAKHRYGTGSLERTIGHGHGYERGTDYATRGLHRVAERGPELVLPRSTRYFNGGETVLNARRTQGALGAGGVHVHGNIYGYSAEEVADQVVKKMRRAEALQPVRA